MRHLLLFLLLAVTHLGFSQAISVNSTTYTVPELVNKVLINSPCVSATNIKWSTGTDFGTNGIGFFQKTNSNFKLESGVILSTGSAAHAPGPNTTLLNDGSKDWLGDRDLEQTMAAAGIPMKSTNATVLEFDFTPISSYFSFDFVFASEEYGNFQCRYSDAFAFLLTDMNTGITTNLAVVPKTNDPISVVTIRDYVYNSSCPPANPQYFDRFNGGANASTAATNFNGRTEVLTASSSLIPGVPYHIKLVIADRIDPQSDSAVFISANSLNIGQNVLGPDLTVTDNSAVCFGTSKTLDTGLTSADYTFEWKKNGQTIPGETAPSLTITEAGKYSVKFTNVATPCMPITDDITIELAPEIITPNPVDIYRCDSGATAYTFNLDSNTPIVKNGLDAATKVSYFISQDNARNGVNPLPLQYSGTAGQIIYTKIQLPNSDCYTIKTFKLLLAPPPVAKQPNNLSKCTKSGDGKASFNLDTQTSTILNGQSKGIYEVFYFYSEQDAINNIKPIVKTNGTFSGQTIYARLQNIIDPNCFSITNFELIVNPTPPVDVLPDVVVCEEFILPVLINGAYFTATNGGGTSLNPGASITETQIIYIFNQPDGPRTCAANSSFKVTVIKGPGPKDVISCGSYTLPEKSFGKYYTEPNGGGKEIPAGTKLTASQTVYYFYETTQGPYCSIASQFNVTINPGVNVGKHADIFECSSYTLPVLSVGKYYSGPNGSGNKIPEGTVITTSQTIYVYAGKTGPGTCSDEDDFNIVIGMPQPANIVQCNGYTLPKLPAGNYYTDPKGGGQMIPAGTVIKESTTLYIYAQTSGVENCTDNMSFTITITNAKIDKLNDVTACESYSLPALKNGEYYSESGGNGMKLSPGDVITSTRTIYVFARLNATCYTESPFTVTIVPIPAVDSRSDIDICNQYILTPLKIGNYYTGPNGTGDMLQAGDIIKMTQKIYIYATAAVSTVPACSAESSFKINIFSANADKPANVTACDSYTLPGLTALNKYYTQPDGPYGSGKEILPGTVITSSQTIYVFKEALIRTGFTCADENPFTVTINKTPVIPSIADVNACESYTIPSLTVGDYYTGPNATGKHLKVGDVLTKSQTLYIYAHLGSTPDCWSEKSFKVNIYNVDDVKDVTTCESYALPNLTNGYYYTGPNGSGTLLTPGTVIKTSQTLYVYGKSPFSPSCGDETSFSITIIKTPFTNPLVPALRSTCDEDGNNDGITTFDLTSLSAAILGTQTAKEFSIDYYATIQDASTQRNPITVTDLTNAYARVTNNLAPDCYALEQINLIVNKLPEPKLSNGYICLDNNGKVTNPYTIQSNLTPSNHKFIWRNEAGSIVSMKSSYQAIVPGKYTLVATNTITGCESLPAEVNVTASAPPLVTFSVDTAFSDHQSIEVTATGSGNYEYQLDGGTFQDENVFENVSSGTHLLTVRDKFGCGSTTVQAIVLNYPKYFTPNGDGYHETWNIIDLANQPYAAITIFDRYGKLLTQFRPNTDGWDGTYNGYVMPSDDYWFTVSYKDENQNEQVFKAHFALKR